MPGMPVAADAGRAPRGPAWSSAPPNANMAVAGAGQPGAPAAASPDPFDRELRGFQYDVTLGDWAAVKAFLARLPEEEGKAAYEQLIQGLGGSPGCR